MASVWEFNLEYNRWVRAIHDHYGNVYYEWDQQDGLFTPATVGQDASVPRQSTAFPKPDDAYGNRVPFTGPGHASHPDAQPAPLGYSQAYTNPRMNINSQSSPNGFQHLANRQRVNTYPIARTASNKASQAAWGQVQRRVPRGPAGRKAGRATKSDSSEGTASSGSDISVSPIHVDDLQGLSLGDHPFSHMVLPYGASSQSHRNDPILGNAQRKYGNVVRKSLSQDSYMLAGSISNHETLDPRYMRQSEAKKFFRVGRVFAMLWHENAGSNGTVPRERVPSNPFTTGKYQEPIYSSIRRMIVVKEQKGCCWCVPITTYGGQGVAKTGIDRSKHAVIYMRGDRPQTQRGEPRMIKEPLEVEPAKHDQKLDGMSRVNFGKVYTIEHNVKVLPVGKITEASRAKFLEYVHDEFLR